MRLLLDTNVVLWAMRDPSRITPQATELIRDPANELLVSAASAWEIATKHHIGKLPDTGPLLLAFENHLRTLGAVELPVTSAHAIAAGQLDWARRDPFDRMLAAQCILENVALVTPNPVFRVLTAVRTVWG